MDLPEQVEKKKKIYLLVCEGPTDIEIIRGISNHISEKIGAEIDIRELSPTKDMTTGNYPSHGWTAVKSWCEKYSLDKGIVIDPALQDWQKKLLQAKQSFRWDTLIKFSGADGIILQIDTDIAEEMNHLAFDPVNDDRKAFCESAVNIWLNEQSAPEEIYYLLSTYSSEVWLLATHEPAICVNYEDIQDVEDRLISLGYSKKNIKGKPRLRKEPKLYKNYSEKIIEKIDIVRQRCVECENFCSFLEK
ncbi:hypothetical protein QMZ30_20195 [Pantoea sp. EA-12]|uniref:hypothetical protein n=1 Tax=Pantoea sp. EA-12 TaxID=3043303 RepID=UPI0024B531F2|nr:hypothetical protein [Pantoea sp. EA-12]MDI9223237.1 hypothetical protein [Pantoea sp. EA-12]